MWWAGGFRDARREEGGGVKRVIWSVGVVLTALAGALPALAQDRSETRANLEAFQRVSFGWFMDSRCAFLSASEAIELEWNFETAFASFREDERLVDMAQIIREAAEKAASSGQYDCTETMAALTRKAKPESAALVTALGKGPFEAESSYPELLSAYLANAAAAAAIESRCSLLAPARRKLLFDGYKEAAAIVSERFGPQAVERAETAAQSTASTIARAHCSGSMRPFLTSLFTDLERLRRGLLRLEAAEQ